MGISPPDIDSHVAAYERLLFNQLPVVGYEWLDNGYDVLSVDYMYVFV